MNVFVLLAGKVMCVTKTLMIARELPLIQVFQQILVKMVGSASIELTTMNVNVHLDSLGKVVSMPLISVMEILVGTEVHAVVLNWTFFVAVDQVFLDVLVKTKLMNVPFSLAIPRDL